MFQLELRTEFNIRVTCRDWFQLSLKEGLTVFRDQVGPLSLLYMLCMRNQQYFLFSEFFNVIIFINYRQEFSSDMGSRTVKRIGDVSRLRNYQFPQVTLLIFF